MTFTKWNKKYKNRQLLKYLLNRDRKHHVALHTMMIEGFLKNLQLKAIKLSN